MIEVKNLSYWYDEDGESDPVISEFNLNIEKGSFMAILGHNGSGKSTLAKCLNAILLPKKGEVIVEGMNTKEDDKLIAIRQKVGIVFQNPDNQIVATIVEEDVAFAPENLGIPREEIRRRVDMALKAVDMYELKDRFPAELSGGQKQRVAIAGIIAMKPDYIVLDEPTAMLDPKGRKEVMDTIKMLNREQGITIILITHFMGEAAQADRIVVMDNGKTILDDLPTEVFSNVDILRAASLDVPDTTDLLHELKKAGLDINTKLLSKEDCVEEILKLFEGKKGA